MPAIALRRFTLESRDDEHMVVAATDCDGDESLQTEKNGMRCRCNGQSTRRFDECQNQGKISAE
jgi:hypothetical protein